MVGNMYFESDNYVGADGYSGSGTLYGITNKMMEAEVNNLATEFITDNYQNLVIVARKMGIDESMAEDLVNDVYVSFRNGEINGKVYDPNKGRVSNYITLEQFVYGRLGLYSKNKKYRKVTEAIIRAHSEEKGLLEIPSCGIAAELEDMTYYQRKYEEAHDYDDIEMVDVGLSVEKEMNYLLTFEPQIKNNVRYLLKNLRNIASQVEQNKIEKSVFSCFRDFSDERVIEAFRVVAQYAKQYPKKYQELVENI